MRWPCVGMQGSLIVAVDTEKREGVPGIGLKVVQGGMDAGVAPGVEEADGRVPQGGEHLRNRRGAHAASVFAERHITDPMRAILDVPMLADVACHLSRTGAGWWQTRDADHCFFTDDPRRGGDHPPLDLKDLLCPRPRQVGGERGIEGGQREDARFTATVAEAALGHLSPGRFAADGGAVKTVVMASFKCGWLPLATIT